MKSIVIILALLFAAIPASAQELQVPDVIYPILRSQAKLPSDFVPTGWKLEKELTGDLNKDGWLDAVMVLVDNDPNNIVADPQYSDREPFNSNPRMLAVVFAEPNAKSYKLMLENHKFLPRFIDLGGQENYEDGNISLDRGTIRIELFNLGGSIVRPSFQFRWQNNQFELIGFQNTIVDRSSGSVRSTEINFSTGVVVRSTGSISSDAQKTKTLKLKPGPVYTLDYDGDGFALENAIEER